MSCPKQCAPPLVEMEEVEDIIPEAGQGVGWHREDGAEDVVDEGAHPLGAQCKTSSIPTTLCTMNIWTISSIDENNCLLYTCRLKIVDVQLISAGKRQKHCCHTQFTIFCIFNS